MKIEFQIEDSTYKIANLTVYDWYHIQDELMLNPYAGFSIISYLTGCSEEELKAMDVDDWNDLWRITQDFIKQESTSNLLPERIYKFQKVKYGLMNPEKMTIGQFADLDILINSPGQEKKIHEIMAMIYRPILSDRDGELEIEEYDPDKVKKRGNDFLTVPLKDAVKALNFFLLTGQQYLSNIADYLKQIQETEKMTTEQEEIFQMIHRRLSDLGTTLSSYFQEETLQKWTMSQTSQSGQPLTGLLSLKTKPENKNWKSKKFYQNIKNN